MRAVEVAAMTNVELYCAATAIAAKMVGAAMSGPLQRAAVVIVTESKFRSVRNSQLQSILARERFTGTGANC